MYVTVRFMTPTAIARRMLDLQAEYARHDEASAALAEHGMTPDRSKDDIATEYADALTAFLR